jgi:hypothetical protein
MKGEARHRIYPADDAEPQPSPEHAAQERLERENAELRQRVRNLEGVVRCVAKTLSPYTADAKR